MMIAQIRQGRVEGNREGKEVKASSLFLKTLEGSVGE
jgi:hypothetical protein